MIGATLFSGIGAPEMAMPHWRWAWHAEIEAFPSAVLATRYPKSQNLGDVTADGFTERAGATARPDILVFGSPCQSFSVAGKRLGMDDPRGNLALVALRIVARLKPRWFVFENVPGLLSSAEGRDFGLFLRAVDELGCSLCWSVLDAQYFGVPQRRQRVFAVGYFGDWRYPAAVLLEPESVCGDHPPRREAGQATSPTLSARTSAGGGLGTDHDINGGLIAPSLNAGMGRRRGSGAHGDALAFNNTGQGWWNEDEIAAGMRDASAGGASHATVVAHALNAHGGPHGRLDYESETFVAHALRADGFDASEDGTGRGTPIIANTVRSHPRPGSNSVGLLAYRTSGNCGAWETGDKTDALTTSTDPNSHVLAFSGKDYEIAPTLRAMGHTGSHANAGGQVAVSLPSSVRRLTPRECERLQGFPDDYTAITYRGKPAADGPRYKALGNSMAVPVLRWILSRIERMPAPHLPAKE